jgi:hypothetical protein
MIVPVESTEAYRIFIARSETISLIVSGVTVAGIVALIAFARKILSLPKEMIVVKAALFRLLRSNKFQGIALEKIATCQKEGCSNGELEGAVKAVTKDRDKIDKFLTAAAFGKVDPQVIKEEDE